MLKAPAAPIGVNLELDILREVLKRGLLNEETFPKLIRMTRAPLVHFDFDMIYKIARSLADLLRMFLLNQENYDLNFHCKVVHWEKDNIEVAIIPAEHLKEITYKDDTLGDIACRIKKSYIMGFPKYIGKPETFINETECMYHGSNRCLYKVKLA